MAKGSGEQILERIDRRLRELGLTDRAASLRAGSPDTIRSVRRQLKDGRQSGISTETLARLAPVLETTPEWLLSATGQETVAPAAETAPEGQQEAIQPNLRPLPEIMGARDLPVYAAVEGGRGHMVVSTEPIDLVPRPWYMREVRDGYAVLVVGESMAPAFEPGQMAIVNPRLPPQRDADVILVSGEHEGEFTASIKRLLNWSASEWKLRQFNPKRDFALSRKEWPKALRVVGKYYGG